MTPKDQAKVNAVTDKLTGNHREWLEKFAEEHGIDFDQLMDGARNWIEYGDYVYIGVDIDYDAASGKFWEHYQAYTHEAVPQSKQNNFFSCSC